MTITTRRYLDNGDSFTISLFGYVFFCAWIKHSYYLTTIVILIIRFNRVQKAGLPRVAAMTGVDLKFYRVPTVIKRMQSLLAQTK